MGLPLLKDMLPEDLGHAFEPAARTSLPASQTSPTAKAVEEKLHTAETRLQDLRAAVHFFVDTVRSSAALTEEDAESAFGQVLAVEAGLRSSIGHYEEEIRRMRAEVLRRRNSPAKLFALQLFESQLRMYEAVLALFQSAKDELESLRDSILVQEAQGLTGIAFWGDDDD